MDVGDRVAHYRGELFSPSISESISGEDTDNAKVFPSLPDKLLKAIGLLDSSPEEWILSEDSRNDIRLQDLTYIFTSSMITLLCLQNS
ncbi:hypothetical protein X975_24104, partial [Stegodyphus mimosarum]